MKRHQVYIFFLLSFATTSCMSEQWDRVEFLDFEKKFQLSWNVTSSHIIFELLVNTTGWFGIGFSPNGAMTGADIHVGWVKDGKVYLTDRYGGDFNGFPPLDDEQDLELIGGWECGEQTSIVFKRQLAACNPDQDRAITQDTIRLIYAYSNIDPSNEELQPSDIHQVRGSRSLLLFETSKVEPSIPGEVTESFLVLNNGMPMLRDRTYYHCIMVEIPELKEKHHVIKIEPVIEERNARYIHHMQLSACPAVLEDPSRIGRGGNCYGGTLADWRTCLHVMAGWAVGSGGMTFPKDVGLPIGLPGQTRYFSLIIHYTNPLHEDIRDHSGFRFVYTSQIRKHDAGMLALNHFLAGYNLLVPPNSEAFDIHATCGPQCIGGGMDQAGVSSINIIGAFLHTHLSGRKVLLRHIRNGTELSPIASDETYDYDFQETRTIFPSREVLRGDHLQVSCTFSTAGRSTFVEGGLGTDEEMCAAFLYFYPQIPLTICNAAPFEGLNIVKNILGVQSVREVNASPLYLLNRFRNLLITAPEEMENQTLDVAINNFPWTDQKRKNLSEEFRDDRLVQMCIGPQPLVPFQTVVPPLQSFQPYTDSRPQPTCVRHRQSLATSRITDTCSVTPE